MSIPEHLQDFVPSIGRFWVGGKYRWFMEKGLTTALYLYLLQCSNYPQLNAVAELKKEFEEAVKSEGLVNNYVARPIPSRKVCVFERCVKDIFLEKAIGVPESLPIGLPGIGEHFAESIPNFAQQEDVFFLITIAYPRINDQGLMWKPAPQLLQ